MREPYKQFNTEEYATLQKSLLRKKGSGMQRTFIDAAKCSKRFVDYIRDKVSTDGITDIPIISEPLSEGEYKESPIDTEVKLHDTWANITPETASRVSFWGEVTLKHIEGSDKGENPRRIKASFLAANGGTMPGGQTRIDKALSNAGSAKDIDACVRTILRRLSGLPEARGNRTQYVDCPFGRAWWRIRLSNEIADSSGMNVKSIRLLLHESQTYWEKLVDLVVSRNSILGDQKVRHALIWTLAEIRDKHKDNKILKADSLVVLNRLLGIRCAWQELGILDLSEVKELIYGEIQSLK